MDEPALIYDLHCHSTCSDGILSPSELVSRAKSKGVDVLALTDHDSIAGLAEARVAAQACGLDLINGIEFSCQWGSRGVHVVGLGLNVDSPELLAVIEGQAQRRAERNEVIAKKLAKAGFPGALEGVKKLATEAAIGRPHFAQFLVDQGHVKSSNQAFKKYLGAGKIGDVKNIWPDLDEVIDWIHAGGGQAVLAHPNKYKLTRTKLRALCADFAEYGGVAIEVVSGKQAPGVAEDMVRIASEFGLLASCGSDFHQPDPWQELGSSSRLPPGSDPVWKDWNIQRPTVNVELGV